MKKILFGMIIGFSFLSLITIIFITKQRNDLKKDINIQTIILEQNEKTIKELSQSLQKQKSEVKYCAVVLYTVLVEYEKCQKQLQGMNNTYDY